MKAPPFDYVKPRSIEAALTLLAEHGDEARLLAGGQTLLATLNMRLSEPALLIDITGIDALSGIGVARGMLRIGALVTHSEIEASPLVAMHAPLLAQAAPHIAHRAIRNRGTFGGSIAFADPSAEWPACLLALDGVVVVRGPQGERRIAAKDFFIDLYATALGQGELVVACELPMQQDGDRFVFTELARRHGDYAVVGLALALRIEGGVVRHARLAFLGMGATPIRARKTEAELEGQALGATLIASATSTLERELDPLGDLTHAPETKRHLAAVLARRALTSLPAPTEKAAHHA